MKLYVKNNICCLQSYPRDEEILVRSFVSTFLTTYELVKSKIFYKGNYVRKYVKEPVSLYTVVNDHKTKTVNYIFPRGLYELIPESVLSKITTVDESTNEFKIEFDKDVTNSSIATSLQPESGFDLREDQVLAVTKSLIMKRGVLQLSTGAGKTEVMSSIIKILKSKYPNIKVLVIEPTEVLVTNTNKRFNKYKLDSVIYKEDNSFTETVTVTHPMSILRDIEENPNLLSDINAVFWDEAQHCKCNTWRQLNASLNNVEYAIGLSALAVSEKDLYEYRVNNLTVDESQIIGSTGKVLMYVSAKYYISKGILATPVVIQLNNSIDSKLGHCDNWHKLRKEGIQSEDRTELTGKISDMFLRYGRRVLVLVGTKQQAYDIAKCIVKNYGYYSTLGISFGGESYVVDEKTNRKVKYTDDMVSKFDEEKFNILISTNHLDEGVDISNLDVVILASGGKKDRRIIQRIGRALRRTKVGKYAYVIDFADNNNGVLSYHASLRMKLYRDLIEVPKDLVIENISIEDAETNFKRLEEIQD